LTVGGIAGIDRSVALIGRRRSVTRLIAAITVTGCYIATYKMEKKLMSLSNTPHVQH